MVAAPPRWLVCNAAPPPLTIHASLYTPPHPPPRLYPPPSTRGGGWLGSLGTSGPDLRPPVKLRCRAPFPSLLPLAQQPHRRHDLIHRDGCRTARHAGALAYAGAEAILGPIVLFAADRKPDRTATRARRDPDRTKNAADTNVTLARETERKNRNASGRPRRKKLMEAAAAGPATSARPPAFVTPDPDPPRHNPDPSVPP
jgi:hypothetical protein